jgi:hypothetical protein
VLCAIEAEHKRQKRMELDGAQLLIGDAGRMLRRGWKAAVLLFIVCGAIGAANPGRHEAAPAGCGTVATVSLPASKYPRITQHIRDSWAAGYPRTLRIHRGGAKQRRDRLLSWWQRSHPQPRGDGLDLDEAPAAVLRAGWRADVRPIPERENRSAGASLGAQIARYPDGTCVKYAF